jgi:hypothetical protein
MAGLAGVGVAPVGPAFELFPTSESEDPGLGRGARKALQLDVEGSEGPTEPQQVGWGNSPARKPMSLPEETATVDDSIPQLGHGALTTSVGCEGCIRRRHLCVPAVLGLFDSWPLDS